MSDIIKRKIQKLEKQNIKFKKLLESTLQIASEETTEYLKLKGESIFLKRTVCELENQKKQLEEELHVYLSDNPSSNNPESEDLCKKNVDVKHTLNNIMKDVESELKDVERLKVEDSYLKEVILNLEHEKEKLLLDIQMIKQATEENNHLAEENIKLRNELAQIQQNRTDDCSTLTSDSGQDLVNKLADIEKLITNMEEDIKQSTTIFKSPLNVPTENTVLELRLSSLKKQKDKMLNELRTKLLISADEVSRLHSNTSDNQLKGLLNELEIHKTILMLNLGNLKGLAHSDKKDVVDDKTSKSGDQCIENCSLSCSPDAQEGITIKPADKDRDTSSSNQLDSTSLSNSTEKCTSDLNPFNQIPESNDSLPSRSSEIIQEIIVFRDCTEMSDNSLSVISENEIISSEHENHELPTVAEEEEIQNDVFAEHQLLKNEYERLVEEKKMLKEQIELYAVLNKTRWEAIPDTSSNLQAEPVAQIEMGDSINLAPQAALDDATNEMFKTDEQRLEQRIKELEEDNRRIQEDLDFVLGESHSDNEDNEILETGEKLIRENKPASDEKNKEITED